MYIHIYSIKVAFKSTDHLKFSIKHIFLPLTDLLSNFFAIPKLLTKSHSNSFTNTCIYTPTSFVCRMLGTKTIVDNQTVRNRFCVTSEMFNTLLGMRGTFYYQSLISRWGQVANGRSGGPRT